MSLASVGLSGSAGSPCRVSENRRCKVAGSAGGFGIRPASACLAAMKASIGFRTHAEACVKEAGATEFFVAINEGIDGRVIGWKAQCSLTGLGAGSRLESQSIPSSIQVASF